LQDLISSHKAFEVLRQIRWPDGGVFCPRCGSIHITKNGHDTRQPEKQNYHCGDCNYYFDDLADTIFSGRHQPLEVWIVALYLMGLNLSNRQIAMELDLDENDVQAMTTSLREGVVEKYEPPKLSGDVECDEVYVVAGHKGHPDKVAESGRDPRCRRLKGAPGRGTLEKDKPPILGMVERGGDVIIEMLPDVKRETIEPIIKSAIESGSLIYTDEYAIYNQLKDWGYQHKTVNHGNGEYARDEDGDGFCEVHVNTAEGLWSLLRSWIRPHRGISQEKLPVYLRFFQFIHNARKRGKAVLCSLLNLLAA
jgi:transposase-like protein